MNIFPMNMGLRKNVFKKEYKKENKIYSFFNWFLYFCFYNLQEVHVSINDFRLFQPFLFWKCLFYDCFIVILINVGIFTFNSKIAIVV